MKIKSILIIMLFCISVITCKLLVTNNNTTENKKIERHGTICTNPYYPNGEIISHSFYNLQYSEQHEQPYWVSYKLSPSFLIKNATRKNRFKEDKKIVTGSATLQDYKGSGFDRGHLAPAGSMVFNQTAMNESFYMSNMSPQQPRFNRGIWKRLESKVRFWATSSDSLFVVTGPILNNIKQTIGENDVSVPNQYYKVLIRFKENYTQGIAFLVENDASQKPLENYAIPIDSIEKLTGIDFNPHWDPKVEAEIEGSIELAEWQFH